MVDERNFVVAERFTDSNIEPLSEWGGLSVLTKRFSDSNTELLEESRENLVHEQKIH